MNKNFIENVCYLATKNNIAFGPILREVENVYDYENNFKCVRVSHTTKLRKEYLNFSEEMLSTMSMSEIDDMIEPFSEM